MEKQGSTIRTNTFLSNQFFKLVLLSTSREKAESNASWLAQNVKVAGGLASCAFDKKKLVIFPRWKGEADKSLTSVAVEGFVVYVSSESEWRDLENDMLIFNKIPVRAILSEEDLSSLARRAGFAFIQKDTCEKAFDALVNMDCLEFNRIKDLFMQYDQDDSGSIDLEEMEAIGKSLGMDIRSTDFQESMLAMDNDNNRTIDFNEFINWWKIGRQNTGALAKIYNIRLNSNNYLASFIDEGKYLDLIDELSESSKKAKTSSKISFKSSGILKVNSLINMGFALGGKRRNEMAQEYLGQFTTNVKSSQQNWVSTIIHLKRDSNIDPEEGKLLLDRFKDNIIVWLSENGYDKIASFAKNLLVFETNTSKSAIILAIRLKIDIELLVKTAIRSIIGMIKTVSDEVTSLSFNVKVKSNEDFYKLYKNNGTIGDLLKGSEVEVESSGLRSKIKTLLKSVSAGWKETLNNFSYFFNPYSMNTEYIGKLEDYIDNKTRKILSGDLNKLGSILDILKATLDPKLFKNAKEVEIGLNYFDAFAHAKVYSDSLFDR